MRRPDPLDGVAKCLGIRHVARDEVDGRVVRGIEDQVEPMTILLQIVNPDFTPKLGELSGDP
jgi:hypothetical protein